MATTTRKTTRSNRVRRVALDTDTLTKINRHRVWLKERALSRGARVVDNPRIFTDDPTGEIPWQPTTVTDRFTRARTLAGHPTVRLHDLRHYSITQLLAAGVDPPSPVSNRVGHATTTMTLDRYGHMIPAPRPSRRRPTPRHHPRTIGDQTSRAANVATTLNRYTHVVPAADREAAEKLGRLLGS